MILHSWLKEHAHRCTKRGSTLSRKRQQQSQKAASRWGECSKQHVIVSNRLHQVTLEIEGRIIPNVKMHTRGHSSAMCPGFKLLTQFQVLMVWHHFEDVEADDLRFPKHQFGLRLPKAIPVLGMTPARSRGHHPTLETDFRNLPDLFFVARITWKRKSSMFMYVAVHEAGQTWSGSRATLQSSELHFCFCFKRSLSKAPLVCGCRTWVLATSFVHLNLLQHVSSSLVYFSVWWTVCPRMTDAMLQEQPKSPCMQVYDVQWYAMHVVGPGWRLVSAEPCGFRYLSPSRRMGHRNWICQRWLAWPLGNRLPAWQHAWSTRFAFHISSQGPQDQALQVKTMACTMSGNESSAARAD